MLNELEVTAAPKADPKQAKPVKLEKALADFSQDGFPGRQRDRRQRQRGGQRLGRLAGHGDRPLGDVRDRPAGRRARRHGADDQAAPQVTRDVWTLGRFRLSATRSPSRRPSLPEDFRAILAVAPEVRTEAQKNALLAYFRVMDAELRAKTDALNASRAPLPVDAKLQELRAQLEFAKKPVQPDPALVALRRDVEMSVEQAAARRLTAAQDIAWALINSPAFLFNH